MIEHALVFLVNQLNQYMRNKLGIEEDKVILSYLVDQDGQIAVREIDRVVLTLIDIAEDTTIKNGRWVHQSGGTATVANPPVHINLYIVFTAYFSPENYRDALRFISLVVAFFQENKVFDQSQYNELAKGDTPLQRLIVELFNTDFHSLSHLWSIIGAKHMPMTTYYVRMLTYDGQSAKEIVPPLRKPATDSNPANKGQ